MQTNIDKKPTYDELVAQNTRLQSENAFLKQELAQLKRLIFGQKRERFIPADSNQLDMAIATAPEPEPETETITYTRRKQDKPQKPSRHVLPAHLPRDVVVIEPKEDTTGLKKIGETITEELEYTPATLRVTRYVRPKYAKPNGDGILIGVLPSRPIEKGKPGPGLLAHVTISKYVDHLPLYRQSQMLERQGVVIPRSTLGDWIAAVCDILEPLHALHIESVLASLYLMADETPIRVLDYHTKGRCHLGYHWAYYDPLNKQALFDYRQGRGREGPTDCLKNFAGLLQTDGWQAYEVFEANERIVLVACWAHARRKFTEALDNDPERAKYALAEIQKLYAIERHARDAELSHADRQALRQQQARPILNHLETWLRQNHLTTLPESKIGKAITYALKRWDRLTRYVEYGQVEIDNNLVENAIRPLALGRKNYLFAGSHEGARRAAMLYSLLTTAKLHGIEPFAWLRDVLDRIADHPHKHLKDLLPQNWSPKSS
ncbi:MAG: IS66 family transposase [candidate division KSB1 bacterium]|nr:IS66 family transposase [candidate division KSB1 bacterium]